MIYRFLGDVVLSLKELDQEQLIQYASQETVLMYPPALCSPNLGHV